VDLDQLVTGRHRLEDAAEAFRAAARREGDKVVVTVSG
jgi:L-iditol 2-dehydrogenase